MNRATYTEWDQVPLVCDIKTTARVLDVSVRWIMEQIKRGGMVPQPLPRLAGGKWQWSKTALKTYLDGGYQSQRYPSRKRKAA